jgi:hypothetical protein
MDGGSGASAALRNVVKKIANYFGLPVFHTAYPSDDFQFVLGMAREKLRADVGLEENEAENLRIARTELRQESARLRHEKRLSDRSAECLFEENRSLKAEINELRATLRSVGGTTPTNVR